MTFSRGVWLDESWWTPMEGVHRFSYISALQYSNILWTSCMQYVICHICRIVTALVFICSQAPTATDNAWYILLRENVMVAEPGAQTAKVHVLDCRRWERGGICWSWCGMTLSIQCMALVGAWVTGHHVGWQAIMWGDSHHVGWPTAHFISGLVREFRGTRFHWCCL